MKLDVVMTILKVSCSLICSFDGNYHQVWMIRDQVNWKKVASNESFRKQFEPTPAQVTGN